MPVRRMRPGHHPKERPVAKSATRTSCDSGGHESWLQEWSTPLNGAVLGVRRHSKASDAMLEH